MFSRYQEKQISQALQIVEERKKSALNNDIIIHKESIFEKLQKTKDIYVIKMTTDTIKNEIDNLGQTLLKKDKEIDK